MISIDIEKKRRQNHTIHTFSYSFQVKDKDFIAIYGKSGAGKTTLLRLLAGLEIPDRGKIIVNGNIWFDSRRKIFLPVQKRKIGFVFQDYALFPNLKVIEQLEFAMSKNFKKEDMWNWIRKFEIEEILFSYPHQLSGGQKQRVALLRSLLSNPTILLLDEPLSSLDQEIRLQLQNLLKEIHKNFHLISFIVSHDKSEIINLCNRILVIEKGHIVQSGKPEEIFFGNQLSAKLCLLGKVIKIQKKDCINLLYIHLDKEIIQVAVHPSEAKNFYIGQEVRVSAKAFHLHIHPINRNDIVKYE